MRRLKTLPFLRHNRAVSYTVSAILITAVTVALVLVAFSYAYQVLDRQRGMSEFEIAQKSILAFNDALENVAWKPGAVRSTRFTVQYGYLQLIPNTNNITIKATVNNLPPQTLSNNTFPGSTGIIKYWLSTDYVTFGSGYESYILGNSSSVVSGSTDPYGRAAIRQLTEAGKGWVTINLDYRVRAMRTSVINVTGVKTNYVDIWVIKLSMLVSNPWSYIHDFDLQAKTLSVRTASSLYDVSSNQNSKISVQIGSGSSEVYVPLDQGKVVFNLIVAEVQVKV